MERVAIRGQIDAVNTRFMHLFNSDDIEGVSACYTEDAQFFVPGQQPFCGRAAIAAALTGLRGSGNTLSLETSEVDGSAEFAWETGRYTVATAGGQIADQGKYVVIWKREGDSWRLHRDIINSSQPG